MSVVRSCSSVALSLGRVSDSADSGGATGVDANATGGEWRRMKKNAVAAMAMQVGLTRGGRRRFRVKGFWGLGDGDGEDETLIGENGGSGGEREEKGVGNEERWH